MIGTILDSYFQFFSIDELWEVLSNPASLGTIGTLIVLEGLLSADNAIVLAMMVKHLPEQQRRKALFYGLLGAYLFRFIAIGIGVFLIKFEWVQLLGGGYLLWIAGSHFISKKTSNATRQVSSRGFWKTIIALQMMDIAFSVDSVIAAFGVSSNVWVLFLGGIIGILMMRGVAQLFLVWIERVPELEVAAFLLIAIIGVKMLAGVFGYHLSQAVFLIVLLLVFAGTFVVHWLGARRSRVR